MEEQEKNIETKQRKGAAPETANREEERNQVIVTLENEDGTIRQLTADDDWLYETGIDEGSLWPEGLMPAALEKRT